MIAATTMSGQPALVPNTPAAASTTAALLSASFLQQNQIDRMFASPVLNRSSIRATASSATRAATPTAPHDLGPRERSLLGVPPGSAQNPHGKGEHRPVFSQRRSGTPSQGHELRRPQSLRRAGSSYRLRPRGHWMAFACCVGVRLRRARPLEQMAATRPDSDYGWPGHQDGQ